MLHTYKDMLRERAVLFFIDKQSACCALTKGCSRSWDIQLMATAWRIFGLRLGCRIWIEWVPSEDNPADILSREGKSLFETSSTNADTMLLPAWVDMRGSRDITGILDRV